MAIPRFNFTRLLIDLATAHNMPPPIFIPAVHPLPGHHAFVCQYSGVDAIGGGETEAVARNTAARQVWIEMGHLITVDPRYVIFYLLLKLVLRTMSYSLLNLLDLFLLNFISFNVPPQVSFSQFNSGSFNVYASAFLYEKSASSSGRTDFYF